MKKILVIGSGGAGKTTFATELGKILNIEVIHLDSLYWKAGWIETPKPEWKRVVEQLLARDSWVMDGNYGGTLDLRFQACDTVIFLDLPRLLCLWRVFKRMLRYRNTNRPDMPEGCQERLSLDFILWIWNYPKKTRPKIIRMLNENQPGKELIKLQSRAEVKTFLGNIAP
jgi:adenylate kinase family enzyme